jgi:hypothetical protein
MTDERAREINSGVASESEQLLYACGTAATSVGYNLV